MSAPYYCDRCNTVVDADIHWTGCAYTISFWNVSTRLQICRCPGCRQDLRTALTEGRLRDSDGRRTPRQRRVTS